MSKEMRQMIDKFKNWKPFINENVDRITKPGVDFVYDKYPELSNIGTPEQYSQYLDTIFKTSKVKDILYHGTDKNFNNFFPYSHVGTFHQANEVGKTTGKKINRIIPLIIDTKRMNEDVLIEGRTYYSTKYYGGVWDTGKFINFLYSHGVPANKIEEIFEIEYEWSDQEGLSISQLLERGILRPDDEFKYKDPFDENDGIALLRYSYLDTVVYKNIKEGDFLLSYVIKNPTQIHILGSDEDVEGFENFIKKAKKL
jgi:hypothetical protein